MDFAVEVVMLPVSDIDRSKAFFQKLGWRLDADFPSPNGDFRVVQFTPPGSACSIAFGTVTAAAPGSQRVEVVVKDIEAARADVAGRGIEISGVFHWANGLPHSTTEQPVPGPDPQRRSYLSYANFNDPDGNVFILQEITQRLPGR
jgi:catechol 2,3-dioxygenase-like lactoylglutathione lyase family enzyme